MTTLATKLNLKMAQGATFNEVIRWESSKIVYKTITNITQAAPTIVTAVGHGAPDGWRVKITNVGGMKEINSTDTYHIATKKTVDTIELNDTNSIAFTTYTSGGVLQYNSPVDLTGYTARMQIRAKITDTAFIDEYTTVNGKLVLDLTNSGIVINVDAVTTAAYSFTSAVYSLEMVSAGGVVTPLVTGTLTLIPEVTR